MNLLANDIVKFYDDPYKFVMYVFPWGEKGTPLENEAGPDQWQKDFLETLRVEIAKRGASEALKTAIRIAVTSGHGVGKTALVAWLILWFISTRPHPQIIVTANTLVQLTSKTWRELAKWHKRSINKDWFEWTATKFYLKEHPETWFASAIPWSEHKSEAFAGAHEEHVLIIFDEAAGIPDTIWEVAQGAMTTPGSMWFVFGNPVKNIGRFRQCFGRDKHRWINVRVDSRTSSIANQDEISQWVQDYGEDSDYIRIRVKGEFPTSSSRQYIPTDIVEAARKYEASNFQKMPVIMGVDVARENDDQTVILIRQGRKVHLMSKFRQFDNVQVVHRMIEIAQDFKPVSIFVDGVGIGNGVVDYGRELGLKITNANAGKEADDKTSFFNKRAEMYCRVKQWLKEGAQIPDDDELTRELISVEHDYTNTHQLKLVSKKDTKRLAGGSPDCADALSLTFYSNRVVGESHFNRAFTAKTDWSVY